MRTIPALIGAVCFSVLLCTSNALAEWTEFLCFGKDRTIEDAEWIDMGVDLFQNNNYDRHVSVLKKSIAEENLTIVYCQLRLGTISAGDAAALENVVSGLKAVGLTLTWLVLDSPGGDFFEALAIGDVARENALAAMVPEWGECSSSCVYVYISTVKRHLLGRLGVHSPYQDIPSDAAERNFEYMRSEAKDWLRSMNVSENFFDFTTTVEPARIKYLDEETLAFFGIGAEDATYRAKRYSDEAEKCGLLVSDYGVLMHEWEVVCISSFLRSDAPDSENFKRCMSRLARKYRPSGKECMWTAFLEGAQQKEKTGGSSEFGDIPKTDHILGQFRDWYAVAFDDRGRKSCYVVSRPVRSEGNFSQRGATYVQVTRRGGDPEPDVVSFEAGYLLRRSTQLQLSIDGDRYYLFTDGETAWAYNAAEDRRLVRAMARGRKMVVEGVLADGAAIIDTYSLMGFVAARRAMTETCGE